MNKISIFTACIAACFSPNALALCDISQIVTKETLVCAGKDVATQFSPSPGNGFTDVSSDEIRQSINILAAKHIVDTACNFRPDNPASRA